MKKIYGTDQAIVAISSNATDVGLGFILENHKAAIKYLADERGDQMFLMRRLPHLGHFRQGLSF